MAKTACLTAFRLSVIVPVYNERHVVEASLRRVQALRDDLISSLELIVVDDGSSDGAWEILEQANRIVEVGSGVSTYCMPLEIQ
jgi:glycosyltransferase involved in cell wall biosynthesis